MDKLKELLLESYKRISDVDELAKLCPICYKLIDFCFDNDFKNCPNCDIITCKECFIPSHTFDEINSDNEDNDETYYCKDCFEKN